MLSCSVDFGGLVGNSEVCDFVCVCGVMLDGVCAGMVYVGVELCLRRWWGAG